MTFKKGQIHVWKIFWKDMEEYIKGKYGILDFSEREKVAAYLRNEDKMRYMTGKVISKQIISQYLGIKEQDVKFTANTYGKPQISSSLNKKGLQFNIAHSGDVVLFAFAFDVKVGVDVEYIKEFPNYMELAEKSFSEAEYLYIEKSRSLIAFYEVWTSKEAYVKAIGEGLSHGLKDFSILNYQVREKGILQNGWKVYPIKLDNHVAHMVAQIE